MAAPNSRQTLIEYSLRQLGAPVVDINVDWQQCEDRLDDALQQFSERHFDGVEKAFFLYPVTAQDIANEYINTDTLGPVNGFGNDGPTGADIVTVVKLFQFGPFGNLSIDLVGDKTNNMIRGPVILKIGKETIFSANV